jgi:hypothetical protein
MIELNWSRPRLRPFKHQADGVKFILRNEDVALFDDVGAGKSKQVIDAAHFAYEAALVGTVLVMAPASALSVWADPDPILGEVAKHAWADVPNAVHVFSADSREVRLEPALNWVVTNYEFIRREVGEKDAKGRRRHGVMPHLETLLAALRGVPFWAVADESWMIEGHSSLQSEAARRIFSEAKKGILLNGTPGGPQHVFGQLHALNPRILGFKQGRSGWFQFRARHAKMGGWKAKAIVGWHRMEEFNEKTARVVLRRETRDCVDLPPRLEPVLVEAGLSKEEWRHYQDMREKLVTWLSSEEAAVAKNAGVKAIRLAQICAGFVGGVENPNGETGDLDFDGDAFFSPAGGLQLPFKTEEKVTRAVGDSKLRAAAAYLRRWWDAEPRPRKAVVSAHFRAEIDRAASELAAEFPDARVVKVYGAQDEAEREEAKRLFAPGGDPADAIMVVQPAAGGAGLNFSAANVLVRMSQARRLKDHKQLDGRLERPGQTRPMTFVDVIAVGPGRRRTVDHTMVSALRRNEDLAAMTAADWLRSLAD